MTGLADTMNPAAEQLYRTALRDAIFKLLNDLDMPGKQAQAGRTWVQAKCRPVEALEKMKERTLEVLQEARAAKRRAAEKKLVDDIASFAKHHC